MQHTTTYMKPADVAELLGVSQRTLSRWHAMRVGPARAKVGRQVLFRRDAIEGWLAKNEIHPTRLFEEA